MIKSSLLFCTNRRNMAQKSFEELDLCNSFLFSAAMEDAETCQLALECILDCQISNVTVKTEYNVLYNNEFKYIRLDVLGQDAMDVSYDLEMQNNNEYNLPKRSRYYQAELDLASLKLGEDYEQLKPLYVIFICNFDPFGKKFYRYTFEMQCVEECFSLKDGAKRIFLNTKGKNKEDVPETLIEFLGYLNNSNDKYIEEINDIKVKRIHEKIKELKKNRDLGERYMRFEELLMSREKEGYQEAYKEGLAALINTLSDFLPDVDRVYQSVVTNDIYSQVSKEQVEECYNQIMVKSKNNSANI